MFYTYNFLQTLGHQLWVVGQLWEASGCAARQMASHQHLRRGAPRNGGRSGPTEWGETPANERRDMGAMGWLVRIWWFCGNFLEKGKGLIQVNPDRLEPPKSAEKRLGIYRFKCWLEALKASDWFKNSFFLKQAPLRSVLFIHVALRPYRQALIFFVETLCQLTTGLVDWSWFLLKLGLTLRSSIQVVPGAVIALHPEWGRTAGVWVCSVWQMCRFGLRSPNHGGWHFPYKLSGLVLSTNLVSQYFL